MWWRLEESIGLAAEGRISVIKNVRARSYCRRNAPLSFDHINPVTEVRDMLSHSSRVFSEMGLLSVTM